MNNDYRGIIRKMDELGRIVIPKEIRNTLSLREDDVMEIMIQGNNILLKKHQPLHPLAHICEKALRSFYRIYSVPALVCDTDRVLCFVGLSLSDRPALSEGTKYYLQRGKSYLHNPEIPLRPLQNNETLTAEALFPVIHNNVPVGAVLLIRQEGHHTIADLSPVKLFADLLGVMVTEN